MRNKKYGLLLLCIPLYACYLYLRFLFELTPLPWGDLICLSGFIAAAAAVTAIENRAVRPACVSGVHALLLAAAFLHPQGFEAAKQQMFIYLFYCAPALAAVAYTAADGSPAGKTAGRGKKTDGGGAALRRVCFAYPAVAAAVFAVKYLGEKSFQPGVDAVGVYFAALTGLFVYCCLRLKKGKARVYVECVSGARLSAACAALQCGMHILYYHRYDGSALLPAFPLFLAAVLYFTAFPAARRAVFRSLFDG